MSSSASFGISSTRPPSLPGFGLLRLRAVVQNYIGDLLKGAGNLLLHLLFLLFALLTHGADKAVRTLDFRRNFDDLALTVAALFDTLTVKTC